MADDPNSPTVTEGLTVGIAVEGDVDLRKRSIDSKQIAEAEKEAQRIEGRRARTLWPTPPAVITEYQERVRSLTRDRAMLMSSEQQLRAMLAGR